MPELLDLPDVPEAMDRLLAAEAAETTDPIVTTPTEAEPVIPDQPGDTDTSTADKPDTLPTDTPAAAEPKPTEPNTEPKPGDTKPVDANASKFAKDKARRDDSWKALNAEKVTLETTRKEIDAKQAEFTRREEQFKLQQAKASQKFTPEQYEQAGQNKLTVAGQYDLQADGLEARAAKLEGEGKYVEAATAQQQAKAAREAAAAERGLARQMKSMADHVRKNPDPTVAQIQARNQEHMKHYTLEAAKNWPELTKQGSEFQKQVANHLNESKKQGIDPQEYPIMMYHAARLTAAESAAARVPGMEKQLGELKAKVKELEGLTAPGGGSPSASRIPEAGAMTDEEEGEQLRSAALTR